MHVVTDNVPRFAADQHIKIVRLMDNLRSMVVHCGFMDRPDIPRRLLDACASQQMRFNGMNTSFFAGRMTIVSAPASRWNRISTGVLKATRRNVLPAIGCFRIPPNCVIKLGGQVKI